MNPQEKIRETIRLYLELGAVLLRIDTFLAHDHPLIMEAGLSVTRIYSLLDNLNIKANELKSLLRP